jgi:hypothetical protein
MKKVSQSGPQLRTLIGDMQDEWWVFNRRIAALDDEFAARAKDDEPVASRPLADGAVHTFATLAAKTDGTLDKAPRRLFR